MKTRLRHLIPAAVVMALLADTGLCATTDKDRITTPDGQSIEGTIIRRDDRGITIRSSVGGGTAEIPYPHERIQSIRFARPPELDRAIENLTGNLLLPEWERRKAFLDIPGSDAGEIGLALARSLVQSDADGARQALALIDTIRNADVPPQIKADAAAIRLNALAAAGEVEQALKEAEAMEDIAGADERSLQASQIRARFLQARLAWQQLLELEEEWPRWQLMPDKREERRALLHKALDTYLEAAAFHAYHPALCAEGLWHAVEIYQQTGRPEEAEKRAREIMDRYPDPAFLARAKEFLNQQPQETTRP